MVSRAALFSFLLAACGSTSSQTAPPDAAAADGAPIPCQDGAPGVEVTLAFDLDGGTCGVNQCLTTLDGEFLMTQSTSCGPMFAMPWPGGIHPNLGASVSFMATGPGGVTASGTAQLVAKPSECVAVTVPVTCH